MEMSAQRMKQVVEHKSDMHSIEKAIQTAKDNGWQTWVQNYPVEMQLKPLMDKILQYMPHLKIYPKSIKSNNTTHTVREFFLYTDDCDLELGRVGYRDYTVTGRANPVETYGIYSRKITNAKYHDGRTEYNMLMTANVDKAFKTVSKYIVPYTDRELAKEYFEDVAYKINNNSRKARGDLDELVRNIAYAGNKYIYEEMLYQVSMGTKFKTEVFNTVASKLVETSERMKEEESRKIDALFVRFRQVGDDMYVDVQDTVDVKANIHNPNFVSPPTTYLASEIPEEILNGVSVLNILTEGQYVPRIGQKVDDKTFWLERG
jgi:hypothetical protein